MKHALFKHPRSILSLRPLALALATCAAPVALAATPELACQALANAGTDNVKIQKVQYLAASKAAQDAQSSLTGASASGMALPAHCLVQGEIEPRTGADGRHYGIRFELRLPDNWQQRFLFQGGGGLDGFLGQAVGSIPVKGASAKPALARGYAVASMDGGHNGMNTDFAHDQQARLDYAYAAIGKVTVQAKRLIGLFYQTPPQHSYFMGCSNGGREAMLAAQRYPSEFDGVVAGNAGFHLSRAAVAEAWDSQILTRIAPKDAQGRPIMSQAFTDADLKLISNGVLAACDKLDGIQDGLINNYRNCQFDPQVLQCQSGKQDSCLSALQVDALHQIFGGPKNSRGEALYSTWPYDAGLASGNWRPWKLGNSLDSGKPNARNVILGGPSLSDFYTTPPKPDMDMLKFDFDRDMARLAQTAALNDAMMTYLNTYAARGGKLVIFQGLSDPVFSADDIMHWYEAVQNDTNGGNLHQLQQWARLFMVPGMTHCGEGSALDDFDPLAAVEKWVEHHEAPAQMPAKGKNFPGLEQPLCPYPQVAQYQGGDAKNIQSYACVTQP